VALRVRYEGSSFLSLVFYITLPTLMMHGQTQIKFIFNVIVLSSAARSPKWIPPFRFSE
jgi:hypothetical protein